MRNEDPITIDFETEKIESRPAYPPKPVSVAIRWQDGKHDFLSWGHPDGNNCDRGTAGAVLKSIYRGRDRMLFHNGAFDLDVAEAYFGLRPLGDHEDTLYLAFLKNPREETISLKPLAAKYLGMPATEQSDLKDWIIANVPEAKRRPKEWGAHIARAPASMVGPYAVGDVERTFRIWKDFKPEIEARGMLAAYEREVRLTKITLEMERSGIRIDTPRLKKAMSVFEKMDAELMRRIKKRLRVGDDFNVNSPDQLADALHKAGKLDAVIKTKTGKTSTRVSALEETCNDKELLKLLSIHSVADKYLSGFMVPWLGQVEQTGGRLLPRFNQVRSRGDDGGGGTRSGRYSSSDPNLQTVTANVEESKNKDVLLLMQSMLKQDYGFEFIGLRDYFLPDEGTVLIAVDYNQQELRLLAHFEMGALMRAYLENPRLDIHEYIRQMIYKTTGVLYERKAVKIMVFGMVYGMGVNKLSLSLGEPLHVARSIRDGLFTVAPGIKDLMDTLKKLAKKDRPLRTWGGREYFCEEARFDRERGQWQSFEYKMLNYLIQPSAADVTKQGMLNVHEEVPEARIALQVHDELVCMAPDESYGRRIADAMCRMKFNVPMLADPKSSRKSWARVR